MAQRGRPKKIQTEACPTVDHAKLLKQFEQEQTVQLEEFYKTLAKIRHNVDLALTKLGFIDSTTTLSEAAFKAGRAYGFLDQANDDLEELLDRMYDNNDFDHWQDI